MDGASRAYTAEEARDMLLDHIRTMVAYWTHLPDDARSGAGLGEALTVKDRVEGVAFSILVALDGQAMGFPAAITLRLEPHPDDKQYNKDNGKNWFEPGTEISDTLHEHFLNKPA